MKKLIYFLLLALLVTSCSTYSDEELQAFDKKIATYVKKHNLKMTKSDSGMYYQIHEKGSGDSIKANAMISTIYTGRLLNGKVFDQTKEPVELQLNQLIMAWRELAFYMREGGKATIIVPPQVGYGSRSMPDIPKNSILIFDIEVLATY